MDSSDRRSAVAWVCVGTLIAVLFGAMAVGVKAEEDEPEFEPVYVDAFCFAPDPFEEFIKLASTDKPDEAVEVFGLAHMIGLCMSGKGTFLFHGQKVVKNFAETADMEATAILEGYFEGKDGTTTTVYVWNTQKLIAALRPGA